jgi:hypothetical protein
MRRCAALSKKKSSTAAGATNVQRSPSIGRVELGVEPVPFRFGGLGELIVLKDLPEGAHLVVYYYLGDDLHAYDVLSIRATPAGQQIKWHKKASYLVTPAEAKGLAQYLPKEKPHE